MRIGIFAPEVKTLDDLITEARAAATDGLASFWQSQIFGRDALTALTVIGREVDTIQLGTSVVPTYPRHPMALAQQALTVNAATGGRLTLGIGLSHQVVIESMYGYSFVRPLRHMREYLSILLPLLHGEPVSFQGETMTGNGALDVDSGPPVPVLVAALGPKMLELAGSVAEGTITWLTGPKTIGGHTAPTIRAAAERAGRPEPRVVVALPVSVTDDVDAERQRAAKIFEIYGTLPSYRAMLDREGLAGPEDAAIIGNEDAVRSRIEELFAAGATEVVAAEIGRGDDRARTRALLRSLL